MARVFDKTVIGNIFKTPVLRNILIGYVIIAVSLPLYGAFFQSVSILGLLSLIILLAVVWLLIRSSRSQLEQKEMEDQLVSTGTFLQNILNSSIDGIMTTDIHGEITYCSSNFEHMTGYIPEDLKGKKVRELYGEGIAEAKYIMSQLAEKGELRNYETRFIKKDGEHIDIILSASELRDENKAVIGTLGIFKDITEEKATEEARQEGQRLKAVSVLAAGVAHEFNNALMSIVGYIELLESHLSSAEDIREYVNPMKEASVRMTTLTKQLLAYSQGGHYETSVFSVADFLEETLPVLRHEIEPDIDLQVDFPDAAPYINADGTQMQMVLSAILNNASEAIAGEGFIKISVRSGDVNKDFSALNAEMESGAYMCLRIEDNGKGMDEETRSRIFDPFYSTKFLGRGLGMASVYGIINGHGGTVSVESELDVGTIVRVYLPTVGMPAQADETQSLPPAPVPGEKTVLVIEDEAPLMAINTTMLNELGCRVLKAETGSRALELMRSHRGGVDLALMDIKLPDIGGESLYKRLMEIDPALKVLLCSGYSIDGPAKEILESGAQGFLQKPFTTADLSAKMSEIL